MNKKIPKIKRVNNTNEVNNFYTKIVEDVNKLISNKDYEKALSILEEELSQPYLPIEYYDKFYDLKNDILSIQYNKKLEEKYWSRSQDELLKIIFNNPEYEYIDVFISKCEEFENAEEFKDLIQEILVSKNIPFAYKLYFLAGLISINFKQEIYLLNNNTNNLNKIDLTNYENSKDYNNYLKTLNHIYDIAGKDITKINFALQALEYFRNHHFPEFDFNSLKLAKSICKFIDFSIIGTIDNFVENDIDEIVFSVLREFSW